jgi:muconolactone delta-isomerase
MKILAIERDVPGVTGESCRPHLQAEALRAWELYRAGFVRELYFRSDQSAAVLVLEADSLTAAQDVLATLPLVANALIRFELIPLQPYPGFARLFAGRG